MLIRLGNHAAHLLLEVILGLAALVVLAGCLLAWRLAQGPIDLTALAQREAPRLAASGIVLTLDYAGLAWEGFHDPDAPLDIRWRGATLRFANGTTPLSLPQGRAALSVSRLLLGQIAPRALEIDGGRLHATRLQDGSLSLDPAPAQHAAGKPQGATPGHAGNGPLRLDLLRALHLRDMQLTLRDAATNEDWRLTAPHADVTHASAGLNVSIVLTLDAGAVHTTLTGAARPLAQGLNVTASLTPVVPAAIAPLDPALKPLAALDAPISAALTAVLAAPGGLRQAPFSLGPLDQAAITRATLTLQAGAGAVHFPTAAVALRGAEASINAAGNLGGKLTANLQNLRIALAPPPGSSAPPPTLLLTATAIRDTALAAELSLSLDHAALADLPAFWPPGVGGGARPWLVQNVTSGTADNGHFTARLTAARDFSHLALTQLGGTLDARDLTVWWLRPVPPLTRAAGRLVLDNPDALHIDLASADQGPIHAQSGHMGITGLTKKDQFGDITVQLAGSLPDALAVLNHPRLGLLSRRPITMQNPTGQATATLSVHLPLDARITMDDIHIAARAHLADVHLGAVAAGRDLDDAALDLTVNNTALSITGAGALDGIPSSLAVGMDFRDGGPRQVLEHVTADGVATPAQAEHAGLPAGIMTAGSAALHAEYSDFRDHTGLVGLSADLAKAAVTTPLGWSKPAGAAASLAAQLGLTGGTLTSIDHIRATGPGLAVDAAMDPATRALRLQNARIGGSTLSGVVTVPRSAADRITLALNGPRLDLSTYFQHRDAPDIAAQSTAKTTDDDKPTRPFSADLQFTEVVLAKDAILHQASLRAVSDGRRLRSLDFHAGPTGQITATITPDDPARTRHLAVNADEAGAMLLAAGVADNIRGGHLSVDGTYNDALPGNPLAGTAELTNFRLTNAPAIARLLAAATLYGAVDVLRGPGLGIARAIVPFRWQQRVLTLGAARAFSASVGITATGTIDLRRHVADVKGTVVPAYFFNQLLGDLPVLGKIFSPEKGSGVFAARYSVSGPLANPKIGINPLSALTPGFLRDVFGVLK